MKVFISHSSVDKWIAGQISRELEAREIDSFLDAKDIQTGDSIEDAVDSHLADCDELLMLLSPAALGSNWVMIEIGGAKALKKRLVPILHHVGVNELPSPLAGGLARELNDIDHYFEEVVARGALTVGERKKSAAKEQRKKTPERSQTLEVPAIAVGDRVRLPLREPSATVARDGSDIGWNSAMVDLLGAEATVTEIDRDSGVVRIDLDHRRWLWLADWLSPITAHGE